MCITIAIVHSAAPLQRTVIPEALELILHYKTSRNFFLHKVSAKEQLLDQRIRFFLGQAFEVSTLHRSKGPYRGVRGEGSYRGSYVGLNSSVLSCCS